MVLGLPGMSMGGSRSVIGAYGWDRVGSWYAEHRKVFWKRHNEIPKG